MKARIRITLLLTVLLATLMCVTAVAAISVEKGVVVGLDSTKNYEYAPVDVTTYTVPIYTAAEPGIKEIKGLNPGLYYVREVSGTDVTAIHIPGTSEDMSGIGTLDQYDNGKEHLVAKSADYFIPGTWTGTGTASNAAFATYYLSEIGGSHIPSSYCSGLVAGTVSRTKIRQKMQSVVFKYAYKPEDIIPVDDLYTMSFSIGIRLGSLAYNCDTLPSTKYVLYTMDESGNVTQHVATFPTSHTITSERTNCSTTHTIVIENDFPDASGWIIALDIYPYGVVPSTAKFEALAFENYEHTYYNTMYFMEYRPSGYATKYSTNTGVIPTQYNGANTSYIKGYGNGTFAPDSDITKAEVATILSRLILNGSTLPTGFDTSFADVTLGDWFYDEFAYLESLDAFEYTSSTLIHPNTPITRSEFALMLFHASHFEAISAKHFKDVAEDDECYDAVSTLAEMGIFEGYADKTFRPDTTLTRAEAVTVFNRLLNLIADETTVVTDGLENTFNDISGHWAEYQILMASNDNVKSEHHAEADASGILLTDTLVSFETDYIKIDVNRSNGRVVAITNKYDNTDIMASSTTPWFFYLISDGGVYFYPSDIDVVNGRLKVKFGNKMEAYFIVKATDTYITFELDSKLPYGASTLYFAKADITSEFSNEPESYRISSVAMNANTDYVNFPGGKAKAITARVMSKTGSTMGGKVGFTFSKYGDRKTGEHRAYLKQIVDAIDPKVGTTSTHGGPYTLDNSDLFGDYLITSSGLSASTASATADILNKYSINQLDIHQGGSSFIQGDFNFKCAAESGETFTTAKQFKERIGDKFTEKGIQLGLHTYSSLVSTSATTILTDPKWQKDLLYEEDAVLTLKNDVTATDKTFLTNEDASGIQLYGYAAGGGTSTLPWSGPNTNYFLIDEELFRVTTATDTGLTSITRAVCGTKAAPHAAGAEIRHLLGHYSMLQPKPGSDLFYHIADLTAQAYNDGGFEMIYLDGLESFARDSMIDTSIGWYYYASFIQRVVSGCEIPPIIEGSSIPQGFWAARGRAGAVDNATRQYKKYNYYHAVSSYNSYFNYYYTATLGWFNYAPDVTQSYKNTWYKTMFVDDLDHMGSLGIAFEMSTVYNHSVGSFTTYKTVSDNAMYFNLYSRLRKANYFSEAVKETLRNGYMAGKEYKVEEQADGTWAFREMKYLKHKVFDLADNTFASKTFNNPYNEQTPYIRIEQKYSTVGANETVLYEFDETTDVVAGTYSFDAVDLSSKQAFKMKITGNGIEGSALLLRINTAAKSEVGYLDLFIPTDFTGTREFILIDTDNADYDGYSFSGVNIAGVNYGIYRSSIYFAGVNGIKIHLTGDCTGVKIDDLRACTPINAPAVNPTVKIGNSTITFKTTVRSGEYIEYLPEQNKAYLHSYNVNSNGTNGNTPTVSEITFSGTPKAPAGDFSVTYSATGTTDAPLRAYVTVGIKNSEVIANEATWVAPEVDLPEDIQYTLYK